MSAKPSHQSSLDRAKQKAKDEVNEVKRRADRWWITPIAVALFHRFQRDNTTGLAAQVAYNLIFSIPPFLVFLIAIAALVDRFTGAPVSESLRTAITNHAPANTKPLLDAVVKNAVAQVGGKAATIGAIVTIVLALWSASGAIGTLVQAFNSAYEVKQSRSFISSNLINLGLTMLFVVVIVVAFVLFIFGQRIGLLLAGHLGLGSVFTTAWNIARWPAGIILFLFLLALLYYWGPDIKQSFRWVSPGSLIATTLWILAILGFKLYLSLSNPGSGYGAFGSVMVFLFFLYLSAIIFILGAQINAVLEKRHDPETKEDLAQHPEQRTTPPGQRARERHPQRGA